ncbi:hypothetical protein LPJ76_001162 [Coemansia sp. RSA 638]|nr:hypothetical protein LPJ76_001162 [Coemansia sp. RSA 638]
MHTNVSPDTRQIRELILRHRPEYIRASKLELSVNALLKCKQRQTELVAQLEAKHATAAEIKRECETQIWGPARRLKESLGTGQPAGKSNEEWAIIALLWLVLRSYSVEYEFAKQNICYDVKVKPLQHLKAFVCLNAILARKEMRFVQALPLRRAWVYAHVPLNTCILVRCIFNEPYTATLGGKKTIRSDVNKYWGRAVDLQQDMFRSHKRHKFLGFAMTDGVSISANRSSKSKSNQRLSYQPSYQPSVPSSFMWQPPQLPSVPSSYVSMPAQQPPPQTQPVQRQQKQADCAYISELSQEQLQSTAGRCVLVDPGRRDLLFMLHEESTVAEKQMAEVAALERTLSAGSFTIPGLDLLKEYLTARAEVAIKLTRHCNKTMCPQRVGATTPEVPLHCNLRLSVYVNRQRADQLLIKRLRERFSQDVVFILGNWGAPMAKFHEPIRGKGWRTLLKRAGFTVYLIDEYLTSKTCPICKERISTFLNVPNPRPFRRTKRPMVKCHGLLSCQSQTCVEFFNTYQRGCLGKKESESEGEKKDNVKRQLWNCDLAAVLNFRKILFSLRETGTVPTCFQRKRKTTAPKAPKTTARKTKAPVAPAPNPN